LAESSPAVADSAVAASTNTKVIQANTYLRIAM